MPWRGWAAGLALAVLFFSGCEGMMGWFGGVQPRSRYWNQELHFSLDSFNDRWTFNENTGTPGVIVLLGCAEAYLQRRPIINVTVEKTDLDLSGSEAYGKLSAEKLRQVGLEIKSQRLVRVGTRRAYEIVSLSQVDGFELKQLLFFRKPFGYVVSANANAEGWKKAGAEMEQILGSFRLR